VLHPNVKFASLKEQTHFYGDIPEADPIDYHDVDIGQGSPEELADAIEGLLTSAEQAGISRDCTQSLRQLVTECKDGFSLKLGADPPVNVKLLVIKLHDGAEPVRMSARKYAPPQLNFSVKRYTGSKSWAWCTRTLEQSGRVLRSSFRSQGPTSIA
jgi:hypothetical protein